MYEKDPKELLRHILDECNFLISCSNGLDFDDFIKDEILKRAVVRSLEIIGEASKKIPSDIKSQMYSVPWKSMSGMRDRLIHDYIGVNYLIIWDVLQNKIPILRSEISKYLNPS